MLCYVYGNKHRKVLIIMGCDMQYEDSAPRLSFGKNLNAIMAENESQTSNSKALWWTMLKLIRMHGDSLPPHATAVNGHSNTYHSPQLH